MGLARLQWISSIVLLPAALLVCLGVWAVLHLPVGSAGVHEWLPAGRPERVRYEAFLRQFGSDQVVLASWQGCRVDDPRLPQFRAALESHPLFPQLFAGVESSDQLFARLTSGPLELSVRDAARRLQGVFLGVDGTALALIHVAPPGVARQRETLQALRDAANQVAGLGADQLRMVGTVFEAHAVDAAAERSLKQLVLPSTLLGFLISWYCLGNVRAAGLVLLLAGLGQLIAVSLVYYTGHEFSAVLIVLPTLIFMLTLSGAVHLANYFWEVPHRTDPALRGAATVQLGWRPCTLSSLTTMLGMGSLVVSQLHPVRQFGWFSALGLGLATSLLLLAFPAVASWIFAAARRPTSPASDRRMGFPRRGLDRYLALQTRRGNAIAIGGVLLLALSIPGVARLQSSTKFCDMFPPQSQIALDMQWFERTIGPIAGTEVLLTIPRAAALPLPEQLGLVRSVTAALRAQPDVGGVLSVVTFLPKWSNIQSVKGTVSRTLLSEQLDKNFAQFQAMGLVARDSESTTWRIVNRVSATSRESYGQLAAGIAATTCATLDQAPAGKLVRAEITGLSPVMHETQVALLTDLLNSFLGAFALITPVMIWIAGSVGGGLLLMIPNILPVMLVFGLIGGLGWPLDIAGLLTASIALGIAVDDTLHFVNWYLRERRQGASPAAAVRQTLDSCATAMVHTSIICCGTMLPFLFADFIPTRHFAAMMIAMLSAALVTDVVLLPALLLSPCGRWVGAKRVPRDKTLGRERCSASSP